MPQVPKKPTARICTRIYADNLEFLDNMAEVASGDVSRDLIIRTIIDNYVTQIRAKERENIDSIDMRELEDTAA